MVAPPGPRGDHRCMLGPVVDDLLELQCGVIARFQALEAGLSDHDVRRLVRRREWARVHPGVYVDHTGPLTWIQRAWAAVLVAWPAALTHDSALRVVDGPGRRRRRPDDPIHVAVDRQRAFRAPPGVVAHRLAHFEAKVLSITHPPRVRIEHAAIDVAAEAPDDLTAVAVLADLVQGTCSLLERDYLDLVELAHGLPRAQRQVRESRRGLLYRDVVYVDYGVVVELDGRLFHDSAQARDLDLERDLDAAVAALLTVRLGWGQAHVRPCDTAVRVGRLLQQRGWTGDVRPCPACPTTRR